MITRKLWNSRIIYNVFFDDHLNVIYQNLFQRLGTIHSLDIDKKAWCKGELRGRGGEQEVGKDGREKLSKNINSMQESYRRE